jgi:acetylornithine/N-succinyldiaminopimelate aminotransferase
MNYKEKSRKYIMDTYRRYPLTLLKGAGSYVYDDKGKKYLDFIAGIAVCNLGHCPAELKKAVKENADKLIHTSNLFYTAPQIELAELLVKQCLRFTTRYASHITEPWKAFFCNSGAEANEAAIKLARKYHRKKGKDKFEIVTFNNSFHGRTYGALSATGQEKFHKGFEPMLPGFTYVDYNDLKGLKKAIGKKTAAIMIELIQAEGGVKMCAPEFLKEVRDICGKEDILLIYDEVQTGMGRTGRFFAYENYNIQPDILTLAKGIAGGLPMGVMLAKDSVAVAFEPGNHASTFGGGPLVSAVALNVVKTIASHKFLADVRKKGSYLREKLTDLKKVFPIKDVRGMGLLTGVEIDVKDASKIVETAMNNGLLINITAGNVVRLVPPLTVTMSELDEFLSKFYEALEGAL